MAPRDVELDAVAHRRRRNVAERDVRVGDGRLRAAAAERDRARTRAGASRADAQRAAIVDPREAAAARGHGLDEHARRARSARRRPTRQPRAAARRRSTRPTSALVPPMSIVSAFVDA